MDHSLAWLNKDMSHAFQDHPRGMGHDGEFWQNMVHWKREWQTTSVFLPWEPHEQHEKAHYLATLKKQKKNKQKKPVVA